MNDNLLSVARDNTMRVSSLKLNNLAKLNLFKYLLKDLYYFQITNLIKMIFYKYIIYLKIFNYNI